MWKVIYIAKDIGNVEILVSKCETQEAVDLINQALIYNDDFLE